METDEQGDNMQEIDYQLFHALKFQGTWIAWKSIAPWQVRVSLNWYVA